METVEIDSTDTDSMDSVDEVATSILGSGDAAELVVHLPPPSRPHRRMHTMAESASRLLMSLVDWVRALPAASLLTPEARLMLFKKCWPEVFVLALAKYSRGMELRSLLPMLIAHLRSELKKRRNGRATTSTMGEKAKAMAKITAEDYPDERLVEICVGLERLRQFINRMDTLRVKERESAHLRALCLFSIDGVPEDLADILEQHRVKLVRSLKELCLPDEERSSTLLLQLPPLRVFNARFIEDVFFVGAFGDINLDHTVTMMLQPESQPGPHSAPHSAPQPGPHSAPHSAPQPGPHSAPHSAPQPGPHSAPHSAPQPGPHSAPHSAPQPGPHSAPQPGK